MSEATPWAVMLGAAARVGVAPSTFWRLSLKEWRALISKQPALALSRGAFEMLAARFPDTLR
jgi:uncharacterized phage protein (TIGR02216 family)